MLKRSLLPAALALAAAISLAAGCQPPPPRAAPPGPSAPGGQGAGDTAAHPPAQDMADTAPVAAAVRAAMEGSQDRVFPRGAVLRTVTVHGGVAALDFSPEFSALANLGDSSESAAQKRLRKALAKFPVIEKMTVTVNGKPYDSQTTDWTTPFPVRETDEEKEAAQADVRPAGAGKPQ